MPIADDRALDTPQQGALPQAVRGMGAARTGNP